MHVVYHGLADARLDVPSRYEDRGAGACPELPKGLTLEADAECRRLVETGIQKTPHELIGVRFEDAYYDLAQPGAFFLVRGDTPEGAAEAWALYLCRGQRLIPDRASFDRLMAELRKAIQELRVEEPPVQFGVELKRSAAGPRVTVLLATGHRVVLRRYVFEQAEIGVGEELILHVPAPRAEPEPLGGPAAMPEPSATPADPWPAAIDAVGLPVI